MTSRARHPASRRLLVASVVLGLFVLVDVGLFGWLILRSMSKREIERVLLETREEAEGLARRLAGRAEREGEDLFTVTALEREVQTYIDSVLKQRRFVSTVEVRDSEGRLVFRGSGEATLELDPAASPLIESGELSPRVEVKPFERTTTRPVELTLDSLYDLDVPIGELGILHVGISQGELEKSVEVLRTDLVRQTALIASLTAAVLAIAYLIIWLLWKRGRRLEEQAAEAERMAYIGTLASGLAHEIRNPLNSLSLNMQLLEEEDGEPADPSRRRLMAITRAEIGRLERLVTGFLSYARPRPLELEEVEAAELLERCRDLLTAELELRGRRLEVEDRTMGARVRVDPEQMGQLLLNLIQNAFVASEEAGREPLVLLRSRWIASRVALEVEDHGDGIPESERERIFELFYSTRKGGTGLGLAVVRRIARDHGGEIEIESSPGRGTRVRLLLPGVRVEQDRAWQPERVRRPAAGGSQVGGSWLSSP